MNLLRSLIAAAALCLSLPALAAQTACPPEASRATAFGLSTDTKPTFATNCATIYETDTSKKYSRTSSGWTHTPDDVTLGTLLSGEDQTNGVMKTEQRFSVCIDDADVVCNDAPAFLHSVWCYPEDAAATAGSVRLLNATAAGAAETTEVWGMDFAAAAMLPVHAVLDIEMTTGIVWDFTTTADVKCGASFRDNP